MENLEVTKGCVYFFKHVGLSPIKIGYTTHLSPIGRFEQFKTYAPYGAELIGFIRTFEAKILETKLHERFANRRLNGEWFDISIDEANNTIKFYSGIEDVQEMNNFQVAWARSLEPKLILDKIYSDIADVFNNKYSLSPIEKSTKVIVQKKEICELLSCDLSSLNNFVKSINLTYTSHRLGNYEFKKGYLLYEKHVPCVI